MDIQLYQISPSAYAVIAQHRYDLGNLFCCVQEFYESSNPDIRGRRIPREQLMRMYALTVSEDQTFSYSNDWCGFNIPGSVLSEYYDKRPTSGMYDLLMWRISQTLESRTCPAGQYYVIGVTEHDTETLHHELAHIQYATNSDYRYEMNQLINDIDSVTLQRLAVVLRRMGYDDAVHFDEIQANFSTGLTNYFNGFEHLCQPFEMVYKRYSQPLKVERISINTSLPETYDEDC